MNQECTQILTELLGPLIESCAPLRARWIGDSSDPILLRLSERLTSLAWSEELQGERWQLAIIDSRDGSIPVQELAWWRDLGAEQLFVLVRQHEGFDPSLAALGLQIVARGHEHAVWAYDIARYKPAPDWLNPRYWANPERWNQDRW